MTTQEATIVEDSKPDPLLDASKKERSPEEVKNAFESFKDLYD